ncbi:kinesin-like protein KIF12 isoform X1 [Octopus bimaculoides]|uniref:kinesin-like protein KIF12 isoform X1 n=2 Tax=Octopus bimaculoides TaxID=37653 RepID=UPI00071D435D|nr:kinesin-like protein KIF12 isoform X1 [Octopus bimaculoides]|eukprot:XP_014770849.1 PREDICTED: kinesin-like protein KIF12 isoform X2 [Octopus bimaculoides]
MVSNQGQTPPPQVKSTEDEGDKITVVLRVRPLTPSEISRKDSNIITFQDSCSLLINQGHNQKKFSFDAVFKPEADQEVVFEESGIQKLIQMAVEGYSCLVLAYGQTGSGKTHTMVGSSTQAFLKTDVFGVVQRAIHYLFSVFEQQVNIEYTVKASHAEIYNEQIIDLLNPQPWRHLALRWSKKKNFYVENLFQVECESVNKLLSVLEEGSRNRHVGSHRANELSSRSHAIFTISIASKIRDPTDSGLWLTRKGKLIFTDLAGSEKVRNSCLSEDILTESNSINKSLLVLGKCISSLSDPKKKYGHIPYRDSKLTKLLSESLSGAGVVLLIACITPSSYSVTETINTLRYSTRAKCILTKPVVAFDPREKYIGTLKKELQILRNENQYLKNQLSFPTVSQNQVQSKDKQTITEKLKQYSQMTPKLVESSLYEMLQEYMVENESLRSENRQLYQENGGLLQEQKQLYKENETLLYQLEQLERMSGMSMYANQKDRWPSYQTPPQLTNANERFGAGYKTKTTTAYGQGNGLYLLDPIYPMSNSFDYPNHFPGRNHIKHSDMTIMKPTPLPRSSDNSIRLLQNSNRFPRQLPQKHFFKRESYPRSVLPNNKQWNSVDSVEMFNQRLREELAAIDGEIKYEQISQATSKSLF